MRTATRWRLRLLSLTATLCLASGLLRAETITLYQNDFETPNVAINLACYAIDGNSINNVYGTVDDVFSQVNTVETLAINTPQSFGVPKAYSDPQGIGGNYAISMLNTSYGDRLGLTFDSEGKPFINVGMDISAIDVYGCGGPFGIADPKYRISLLDSPGGVFGWSDVPLDFAEVMGAAGSDQWTFNWSNHVVALDTSGNTDGTITIVWELLQSGYGAFDNLIITASDTAGDVGQDGDVCVYQEDNPGQQDFSLVGSVAVFDRSDESAADIYSYNNPVTASYSNLDPPAVSGVSQFFFVDTSDSDGISLFIVQDAANDGSGGRANMDLVLSGDEATVLVQDDGGEIDNTANTEFAVRHFWSPCCTDGGVIGTLEGNWSMTVDVSLFNLDPSNGSWEVLSAFKPSLTLDPMVYDSVSRQVMFKPCEVEEPAPPLAKMLVGGPHHDSDEVVDSIIEVKQQMTTEYLWQIKYNNPEGPAVVIFDTVPSETRIYRVNETDVALGCGGRASISDDSGMVDLWRGGKEGKRCQSSTHLAWIPETDDEVLSVAVRTRQSPGKGHKRPAFAPTSCGALYLNEGAVAYALNPENGKSGEPLLESNALCVAAVKNPTEFGADADNDADGLSDFAEACENEIRTNPCRADTDGDGLKDGEDPYPLIPGDPD